MQALLPMAMDLTEDQQDNMIVIAIVLSILIGIIVAIAGAAATKKLSERVDRIENRLPHVDNTLPPPPPPAAV